MGKGRREPWGEGREGGGSSEVRGSGVKERREQWGEREERERGGWHDKSRGFKRTVRKNFPIPRKAPSSHFPGTTTSLLVPRGEPPYLGYPMPRKSFFYIVHGLTVYSINPTSTQLLFSNEQGTIFQPNFWCRNRPFCWARPHFLSRYTEENLFGKHMLISIRF